MCNKVSAGLGACIRIRIRPLVPSQTLLRMYEALVLPYLDYCSEVWGCMGKSQCDRLQKLQNKAGRITTFSDYNTKSADTLQDQGWDSLKQRRSKQLAISVFKSLHNLYPEGLKNMFKPTSRVYSHNVRIRGSSNNVFVPRPHTEAAKRAFSYRGAVMWNVLANKLKDKRNLNSFKSALTLS